MYKSIKLLLLCIIISSYTSAYAGAETVLGLGTGLRPYNAPDMAKDSTGPRIPSGTLTKKDRERLRRMFNPAPATKEKTKRPVVGRLNANIFSLWEPTEDPVQEVPLVMQNVEKAIQKVQLAEGDIHVTRTALEQPNIPVEKRRQLEKKLELSEMQLEKAHASRTKKLQKASIMLANTEFIIAIVNSNLPSSSPLLATVREMEDLPSDRSLFVDMVKDRKTAYEAVILAQELDLDLSEQLPANLAGGGGPPLHDDNVVAKMSRDDQKLCFVAIMNRINQENPDVAEKIAKEVNVTHQPEIVLYDEIPRIATDTVNARVSELLTGFIPAGGIAAGDDNTLVSLKSVWVRGLYGNINQGQSSGQAGFHGKTKGGTIGIDGNLTDDTIIGLSYTRMAANFKYKQGQGNKVDTMSDFISLYGISNLNKSFILHGLFSMGKTRAKQHTQHLVGANTFRTATGKTTVTTYNLESILNYKIPMNNPEVYIMPNAGFRFSKNYDGGYSEYGTGIYNLTVSSKQHTSWAIITGIKMGKAHRVSDCLTITTGIHAEIDHYVYNKTSQAKTKLQWADTFSDGTTIMIKTNKTGYNLGASILAADEISEFLATYNIHLRGKYTSHQGSLRFRYLF